jgi:hypothetical protein
MRGLITNPRKYAAVVGVVLFGVGLYHFSFSSTSRIPDLYLLGAIILGFWGILVSLSSRR